MSVTTGLLVSSRHMEGVYEILNFLTGDKLFTHQLPRAMTECEPWLRSQYPQLFIEHPVTRDALDFIAHFKRDADTNAERQVKIQQWVEQLRVNLGLPEMLSVYEMDADMHTHIDPFVEAQAMIGDDKVFIVKRDE
jgi:hypothetical protein